MPTRDNRGSWSERTGFGPGDNHDWLKSGVSSALGSLQQNEGQYAGVDNDGHLRGLAGRTAEFGGRAGQRFEGMTGDFAERQKFLEGLARGENSIAAEQLRQGLQQNVSAQQSMAAGANPQNAAAAARNASNNAANMGMGLSGQQAVAGLQERQIANAQLSDLLLKQRQQELDASLGGAQLGLQGYSNYEQNRTARAGAKMASPTGGQILLGGLTSLGGSFLQRGGQK